MILDNQPKDYADKEWLDENRALLPKPTLLERALLCAPYVAGAFAALASVLVLTGAI